MILQMCDFISVAAFFWRIYGNPSSIPFHRCNEELSPKLKSNVQSLEHIRHEFLLPTSIIATLYNYKTQTAHFDFVFLTASRNSTL